MSPLSIFLLGLELTRFAATDDVADPVVSSLGSVQSGSFSLSPYQGPALQPTIALQRGGLHLSLAPAVSVRRERAEDGSGAGAEVGVVQWRTAGRVWLGQAALGGLDVALSGGRATLSGEALSAGNLAVELAPTAGARAPLGERLLLTGRARLPITSSDGSLTVGIAGALTIEWML